MSVITNTTICNDTVRKCIYYTVSLTADLTNAVIYSSATLSTAAGITNTKNSRIMSIRGDVTAGSTTNSSPARVWLSWDATTPVLAWALPIYNPIEHDFRPIGGLINVPAKLGSPGTTGDITITSVGMTSGDILSLVIEIDSD